MVEHISFTMIVYAPANNARTSGDMTYIWRILRSRINQQSQRMRFFTLAQRQNAIVRVFRTEGDHDEIDACTR